MKNNKKNIFIILILSIVVLYLAFKDDFATKVKYLVSFDIKWLILAFMCIIIYWILKGLVLYYCVEKLNKNYTKKEGIILMITTQLFHAITPFSTGGQPWQIYKLKKEGLTLGQSTNIVIQDFIYLCHSQNGFSVYQCLKIIIFSNFISPWNTPFS